MIGSRSNGRSAPRKPERIVDRLRFGLRDRLVKVVTVADGPSTYRFACTNRQEVFRAKTLLLKEEGTCEWLRRTLCAGDVFYDVGANIGLYSIMAAGLVGTSGRVYAFEPHAASFEHLCTNIAINGYQDRIVPLSIALNDTEGLFDFHYALWNAGASASQLVDRPATAVGAIERKYGGQIDSLVERGWLPRPTVIKIDVDGREAHIVRGMARVLVGEPRLRSVQIEIQKHDSAGILPLMESLGYQLVQHHLTMGGRSKMARGKRLDEIAYNAVFEPVRP